MPPSANLKLPFYFKVFKTGLPRASNTSARLTRCSRTERVTYEYARIPLLARVGDALTLKDGNGVVLRIWPPWLRNAATVSAQSWASKPQNQPRDFNWSFWTLFGWPLLTVPYAY
jgi:hypothetical protein